MWRGRGRHRVENFARGVESGVASYPDDPGTSRLIGLANALRSMPLRPSSDLTLALRRRIVNAARAGRQEEPRSILADMFDRFRMQRGLASTTALLTAAVAMATIGFGTTKALPGDTLYGLKLRGERISIALASSEETKGYNYLRFAGARLRDVSGLIDHDGAWRESAVTTEKQQPTRHLAGLVNSTLTTMNGYTDRGATSLRSAYQRTGDPAPLAYLDDFTKKQHKKLSGILGKLPAASQSVAGASLNLVDRLAKETSKLLTERCGHAAACQSQARSSGEAASTETPATTPTQAPATSLTNDIPTSGSPAPGQQPSSQGTSPQRVPSTSEQPPGTTKPTDTSTSTGDQPSSTPTTAPSTGTSDGSDGSGSSTSTDATGSSPAQPSPPQPTGVPSTSSDRSTDSSDASPNGAAGSGNTSSPGNTSSGGAGSTDGSGGDSGSAEHVSAPAARPSEPSEQPRTASSAPSNDSDRSGAPPNDAPSDQPSGQSSTEATPSP